MAVAERGLRGLPQLRCIFATNSTKCDRTAGKIAAMEPDVIESSRAKSRAGNVGGSLTGQGSLTG